MSLLKGSLFRQLGTGLFVQALERNSRGQLLLHQENMHILVTRAFPFRVLALKPPYDRFGRGRVGDMA